LFRKTEGFTFRGGANITRPNNTPTKEGGRDGGVEADVLAEFLAPEVAEAGVHGDADQPGAEFGAFVEGLDALNELDEGVLGEISGGIAVAEHPEADTEDSILVAPDQFTPGLPLGGPAGAHLADQLQIARIFRGEGLGLGTARGHDGMDGNGAAARRE
jgi:hypothetical protein